MFNYIKNVWASAKAAVTAAIIRVKAACKTAALAAAAVAGLVLIFTPAASLVVVCMGLLLVAVTVYTVVAVLAAAVNAAATAAATVLLWIATAADVVEAVVHTMFAFTADLVEHVRRTRRRRILAARRRFASVWAKVRSVTPVAASPVAPIVEVVPIVVETEEAVEVVAAPAPAFAVGADLESARGGVRELRKAARKLAKAKADRGNRRAEMPSETRVKRVQLEDLILG